MILKSFKAENLRVPDNYLECPAESSTQCVPVSKLTITLEDGTEVHLGKLSGVEMEVKSYHPQLRFGFPAMPSYYFDTPIVLLGELKFVATQEEMCIVFPHLKEESKRGEKDV